MAEASYTQLGISQVQHVSSAIWNQALNPTASLVSRNWIAGQGFSSVSGANQLEIRRKLVIVQPVLSPDRIVTGHPSTLSKT